MCKFFSFVSDPDKPVPERFMYFKWEQRKNFDAVEEQSSDSHTSIAHFYGYSANQEDNLNKYEYNPLTTEFQVDQINHKIDDSREAEKWVRALDFNTVVEPLIIKPIIHPFKLIPSEITPEVLSLLKEWDSVGTSVRASVWDSVWDSVGDSVGTSVRASVWDSVGTSVWDSVGTSVGASVGASVWYSVGDSVETSVRASVWDSVGTSVWDSVGTSVGASVGAYLSSFFAIDYKYKLSPGIKLWEMGLVPSFDGKVWRLHGGKSAEILWEGEI